MIPTGLIGGLIGGLFGVGGPIYTTGHRLHAKLTREQVGRFISVLLVVSGLSLLWKAL